MDPYQVFLERKTHSGSLSGFSPVFMPDFLFPFQRALTTWATEKGRAAIWADTGLGKTAMQLTWAQNVVEHSNKPVLLLTPLSVGAQTVREAAKFGIEAKQSRDGQISDKITITNYQQLHKFNWQDFGGLVCDESSIIKSMDGKIRSEVTNFMRKLPYRLLCTATAAPNDWMEIGTSSEALGELRQVEMLAQFFNHDGGDTGKWALKRHAARGPFWQWVCSWARAIRKPEDLGFSGTEYVLPPLSLSEHIVKSTAQNPDFLFDLPAVGLEEQRAERKRTLHERCELAAQLCSHHDISLAWCHLNVEGDLLEKLIPDCRQISGATPDEEQEEIIEWFLVGNGSRRLVGKPSQLGMGMNFQHCAHQTFFPSHSFEQWYQSVRRSWRFGQKNPVQIDIISSPGESGVLNNMKRKAEQAEVMFAKMVSLLNHELKIAAQTLHETNLITPLWLS